MKFTLFVGGLMADHVLAMLTVRLRDRFDHADAYSLIVEYPAAFGLPGLRCQENLTTETFMNNNMQAKAAHAPV